MNIELYDKIKNLYLKYHKEKTWNHVESVAKEAKISFLIASKNF